MAEAVYLLCAITSLVCMLLLVRGYLYTRVRLLLWSSLCFVGLAVNNVALFMDLVIVPGSDLSLLRTIPAAAGVVTLLIGLIWETT